MSSQEKISNYNSRENADNKLVRDLSEAERSVLRELLRERLNRDNLSHERSEEE